MSAAAVRREEWAMMYAAGLTATQITHICGVKSRALVTYHLSVAVSEDPGLEARHTENRSPVPEIPPASRAVLDKLSQFKANEGRFPESVETDLNAIRLYRWLTRRRKQHSEGQLSPRLKAALDQLGDWEEVDGGKRREAVWQANLKELVAWRLANNGQWPSWQYSADEDEKRLGVWVHGQRYREKKYPLGKHRRDLLDAAAPGWDERRPSRRWVH